MADDGFNPAVQGRRLRSALKLAREQAGPQGEPLTQDQVATRLEWSLSKVARVEPGVVRLSTTDLRALLDLYGIKDPARVRDLESMARAARKRPWWDDFREVTSQRYLQFVEFEQAASESLHYEPQVVPGLFQTLDYASAVISSF